MNAKLKLYGRSNTSHQIGILMVDNTKRSGKQSAEATVATKLTILEAATDLFTEKGFEATSLREIAKKADLTHGIIRHHFGSKLDIWRSIAENTLEKYTEIMTPILINASENPAALDAFKQVVTTFVRVTNEHSALVRLMAREGSAHSERSDFFQEQFELLHSQIAILFDRAKQESAVLSKYTSDSFFFTLLSLTAFPIIVPVVSDILPIANINNTEVREAFIFNTLFS